LDAILAECLAESFEPWPGSLVAALVRPEQIAEARVPPAVMELQTSSDSRREPSAMPLPCRNALMETITYGKRAGAHACGVRKLGLACKSHVS
jgi:hypothetical protein